MNSRFPFRSFPSAQVLGCALLGLLTFGTAAPAQSSASGVSSSSPYSRWTLGGGFYYPSLTTEVRIDTASGLVGTEVSFEDDLDMEENKEVFEFLAGFRFSRRWAVEVDYIALDRVSTGNFDRQVVWNGVTYNVGATFGAKFDVAIARLGFSYDFIQRDNVRLGFAFGAHLADVTAGIGAQLDVNDEVVGPGAFTAGTGTGVPLPNIGLLGSWDFADNWTLYGRLEAFGLEIGEWGGTLWSGEADVLYHLHRNFSAGVGLKFFSVEVDYEDDDWIGDFTFNYFGPKIFGALRW